MLDEDRSRIRTGRRPGNVLWLRRDLPISIIHSQRACRVDETLRKLDRNICLLVDKLRMTENARRVPAAPSCGTAFGLTLRSAAKERGEARMNSLWWKSCA